MLSLFEEAEQTLLDRVLDVPCAACAAWGRKLDGSTCEPCGGAGYFVLGDHEPPCMACTGPQRAARPAPRGLPALVTEVPNEGNTTNG